MHMTGKVHLFPPIVRLVDKKCDLPRDVFNYRNLLVLYNKRASYKFNEDFWTILNNVLVMTIQTTINHRIAYKFDRLSLGKT